MFLEFFIWGAWYVTVGNYMAAEGMTSYIPWAFTVHPIGSIISPFFLGMIADRFFATEKVLGVLHLIGGVALIAAPTFADQPPAFIGMLLLHSICFAATMGLANTLAFHHVTDQERQFPWIRAFGTIGWIASGILVSGVLHADETPIPIYVAGAAALLLGGYSFSLPHTPPPLAGTKPKAREIIGLDALSRLSSRPFWIFIASSLLICIPLSAYYAYAPVFVNASGISDPAFKMSFGQMSELVFMLLMPFFFVRLGVKWMLTLGMAGWVARYALFALGAPEAVTWMIIGGIILHGLSYDFFFVAGQIYVDKRADPEIRGQAQGFVVFVTYGVGMMIGAQIAGWMFERVVGGQVDVPLELWASFWWVPAIFAAIVMIGFAIFFRDDQVEREVKAAPESVRV